MRVLAAVAVTKSKSRNVNAAVRCTLERRALEVALQNAKARETLAYGKLKGAQRNETLTILAGVQS